MPVNHTPSIEPIAVSFAKASKRLTQQGDVTRDRKLATKRDERTKQPASTDAPKQQDRLPPPKQFVQRSAEEENANAHAPKTTGHNVNVVTHDQYVIFGSLSPISTHKTEQETIYLGFKSRKSDVTRDPTSSLTIILTKLSTGRTVRQNITIQSGKSLGNNYIFQRLHCFLFAISGRRILRYGGFAIFSFNSFLGYGFLWFFLVDIQIFLSRSLSKTLRIFLRAAFCSAIRRFSKRFKHLPWII